MKIKLTTNKRVRLSLNEPFFVPENLVFEFESEYRLEKLLVEVKSNSLSKKYIVTDKRLDLSEFTINPGVIEICIALVINGKIVKRWEIDPIVVEEANHEFVLKDYIESLILPLQAEISELKEENKLLLTSYNELGLKHNELALIVKAIKENY